MNSLSSDRQLSKFQFNAQFNTYNNNNVPRTTNFKSTKNLRMTKSANYKSTHKTLKVDSAYLDTSSITDNSLLQYNQSLAYAPIS